MDCAAITRSAHLDASQFPDPFEFSRYFTRFHYQNLQTLSLPCSRDFDSKNLIADVLIDHVVQVRPALMPRLKTLILHGGRVTMLNLHHLAAMENPPRVVFRNVVLCQLPLIQGLSIRLHVHVKEKTIDFSKLVWNDADGKFSGFGDFSESDSYDSDSSDSFGDRSDPDWTDSVSEDSSDSEESASGDSSGSDSGDSIVSGDSFDILDLVDDAVREVMLEILSSAPVNVEDERLGLDRVADITAEQVRLRSRELFTQTLEL